MTKSKHLILTSRHKSPNYKFDIFQKALFCTLASSANLVLKTVQNAAAVILKRFYLFLLKTDHFWSSRVVSKKSKVKRKFSDNLGENICGLFHLLAQFSFTTSKTERDYCQQNVNPQVALGN